MDKTTPGKRLLDNTGQRRASRIHQNCSYVQTTYGSANPARTGNFLAKADVWIITHALVDNGTVVTEELPVPPNVLVPKIPNVCQKFNVPFINTTGLLRALKFRVE